MTDSDRGHFEVVQITGPSRLLDGQRYERVYWRRDGAGLAMGYYVVSWPQHLRARLFNEDAAFQGPFRTHADAHDALRRMEARRAARRRGQAPGALLAPRAVRH